MRARSPRTLVVALMVAAAANEARAAVLDPNLTETVLVSSPELANATGMAWAPDGSNRLFVLLQVGQIRIIKDGALLATPFATASPITAGGELGLLGITFDPNFAVNGYLYVFVTVSPREQQIIRYTALGDLGTARTVIVPMLPTAGANHNGGGLGIGPDGKLYWGIGDNGSGAGVNDDRVTLAAKIGRANLDGSPVADNPFSGGADAGAGASYIWARGFRNPFTLTFQPATGLLWVNVVGTVYEQVFIVRRADHAGYSTYENNQPAGFITPIIKYRTNGIDIQALLPLGMSGAARAGGVATFTTALPHGFRAGEKITVSGVTDPSFNTNVFVASVPSPTAFTAAQPGPDAVSGGGNATTLAIGGCITGGAFYDATSFPLPYRGNFFFGDFNTNRIERVTIDPATNSVTSVDHFATGVNGAVDIAVGPDGDLYYIGNSSNAVFRASYQVTAQALVVSPTNVWIAEGEPALVMVRLAMSPAQDTTVSVARQGGDADIGVASGADLTFTSANWSTPQPVTLEAGRDLDTVDDTATFSVTASGLTAETVTVHARDENTLSLVVSAPALALVEGESGTFTVALSAQPSRDVQVAVARSAGDGDVTVSAGAALTFTRTSWSTPQVVTISAGPDPDGSDDSATISVGAAGLVEQTVKIAVRDDDAAAPVITSTPILNAVAGAPYLYDVQATGLPEPVFTLEETTPALSIDPVTGVISGQPSAVGSFPVTVRAANGVTPDAVQGFILEVAPDAPPRCMLTRPLEGETVSGANAVFSAEGSDDVGTVEAQFHLDGTLASTDVGTSGHYQFAGAPMRWDTTALTNGRHTARVVIFDTARQMCSAEATVTVANAPPDAAAPDGAARDASTGGSSSDSGCGCRVGGRAGRAPGAAFIGLVLALSMRLRRRGARGPR
jgi:glucose/arabinose dehydrogenase